MLPKHVHKATSVKRTLVSNISVMLDHIFMYLTHFIKDAYLALTRRTEITVKLVSQGSFVNLRRIVCSKGNYICSMTRKMPRRLNTKMFSSD